MTFDSSAYSFSADSEMEPTPPFPSRRPKAHVEIPSNNDNGRGTGTNTSLVEAHLGNAQSHFNDDNIEGAVEELIAAAERLKIHNSLVHESMNRAISYLSTMGCRATPPHPKAISLVKLRKTLPA
jgi:hypothetical protein